MMYPVYIHVTTAGGADITIASSAVGWGGFILNGSAGGCTLTLKDSVGTTFYTTSAAATVIIPVVFAAPVVLNGLTATASGTGAYSVLVTRP